MLPANEAAEHWYEVESEQVVLVELPRDDAPHTDYMEWWYYNGHLETAEGRRFAFHYVIFAVNALATHTAAHASLIDLQTGRHFTAQKRTSGNPSRGTKDSFRFELGEWHMVGSNGDDRLRVSTPEFSFNLKLTEGAPPVMLGGTGLLSFELTGSSYYYSRPQMPVSGAVKLDGEILDVSGVAWFDHQWGNFEVNELGWDWFALQLEDGTDIMLYLLFDSDTLPVLRSGTLAKDGQTTVLTEDDFKVTVTDRWTSPATSIEYPMGWTVALPAQSIDLRITPMLRDSEFDGRTTSYKVYWEGPVEITGSHAGKGFVEMSGYRKADPGTAVAR
jgi:predicted secreted hydrolase